MRVGFFKIRKSGESSSPHFQVKCLHPAVAPVPRTGGSGTLTCADMRTRHLGDFNFVSAKQRGWPVCGFCPQSRNLKRSVVAPLVSSTVATPSSAASFHCCVLFTLLLAPTTFPGVLQNHFSPVFKGQSAQGQTYKDGTHCRLTTSCSPTPVQPGEVLGGVTCQSGPSAHAGAHESHLGCI